MADGTPLAAPRTLTLAEAELMLDTIRDGIPGRNERWVQPWSGRLAMAHDLVERGLARWREHSLAELRTFSITTTGARQLVREGHMRVGELAVDAGRVLAKLAFWRRAYEARLAAGHPDPSLGDMSWGPVSDEPYSQVGLAILVKRGHTVVGEPATPKAAAAAAEFGFVMARATDAGMAVR